MDEELIYECACGRRFMRRQIDLAPPEAEACGCGQTLPTEQRYAFEPEMDDDNA